MKTFASARLLAALLLTSVSLGACSQGTDTADTNVEHSSNKEYGEASAMRDTGTDSASMTDAVPDTARKETGREQYDKAGTALDHNHDGMADK